MKLYFILYEKHYVYNIFTINSKWQIVIGCWQIVISYYQWAKYNFNSEFKL